MTQDVMFPVPGGMVFNVDPGDAPPASLADALNVDFAHPSGAVRPRHGSRSLANFDSEPLGGHPAEPLGNNNFDFSASVLRLIPDEAAGRLWAIVRSDTDKAEVYLADLTLDNPGFELVGSEFSCDVDRVPGAALSGGRLFVATGIAAASGNAVSDGAAVSSATLFPTQCAAAPTLALGAGSLNAVTGYQYQAVPLDPITKSRGPLIASTTTGPFTAKNVTVTVTGSANETVFTKVEIYRTTDGGATYRYLAEIANPGAASTGNYVDSTADDKLSFLTPPARTGRTPTCRFVLSNADRLLWFYRTETPINGSLALYSEAFHQMCMDPLRNILLVRPDDGDEITGVGRLYNRVFIFKQAQIYELAPGDVSPFRIDPIVNEGAIGTVAHASIVEIEGRLLFLGYKGVGLFDGQSARLIPGPLSEGAAEKQQFRRDYWDTQPQNFSFNFINSDDVAETFNFEVMFFESADENPDDDTPVFTLDTENGPGAFYSTLGPRVAPGLTLEPGQGATIFNTWTEDFLVRGRRYYVWIVARDGTQEYEPFYYGPYDNIPREHPGYGINWGLAGRFFAIDYWPRREYWLYVASHGSDKIDTKWVLDYSTIDSEGGPRWRREATHATCACLVRGLNMGEGHQNLIAALEGDGNGCVWVARWAPSIDRDIHLETELTAAQRVGSGTIAEDMGAWILTPATSPDFPTLKGTVVTVRDEHGNVYTGVVTDGDADTLTVGFWLGGLNPRDGDVEWSVGGIDARAEFYPMAMDGKQGATLSQASELVLEGLGDGDGVDVELSMADQAEPISTGALNRMRRRSLRNLRCGGKVKRAPVKARGRYIGARFGSHRADPKWALTRWGLGARPTGARS